MSSQTAAPVRFEFLEGNWSAGQRRARLVAENSLLNVFGCSFPLQLRRESHCVSDETKRMADVDSSNFGRMLEFERCIFPLLSTRVSAPSSVLVPRPLLLIPTPSPAPPLACVTPLLPLSTKSFLVHRSPRRLSSSPSAQHTSSTPPPTFQPDPMSFPSQSATIRLPDLDDWHPLRWQQLRKRVQSQLVLSVLRQTPSFWSSVVQFLPGRREFVVDLILQYCPIPPPPFDPALYAKELRNTIGTLLKERTLGGDGERFSRALAAMRVNFVPLVAALTGEQESDVRTWYDSLWIDKTAAGVISSLFERSSHPFVVKLSQGVVGGDLERRAGNSLKGAWSSTRLWFLAGTAVVLSLAKDLEGVEWNWRKKVDYEAFVELMKAPEGVRVGEDYLTRFYGNQIEQTLKVIFTHQALLIRYFQEVGQRAGTWGSAVDFIKGLASFLPALRLYDPMVE